MIPSEETTETTHITKVGAKEEKAVISSTENGNAHASDDKHRTPQIDELIHPAFLQMLRAAVEMMQCPQSGHWLEQTVPKGQHYRSLLLQWKEDGYPHREWLLQTAIDLCPSFHVSPDWLIKNTNEVEKFDSVPDSLSAPRRIFPTVSAWLGDMMCPNSLDHWASRFPSFQELEDVFHQWKSVGCPQIDWPEYHVSAVELLSLVRLRSSH